MPDYMEALISQKGLSQVVSDLRMAVLALAEGAELNDPACLYLFADELNFTIDELEVEGW